MTHEPLNMNHGDLYTAVLSCPTHGLIHIAAKPQTLTDYRGVSCPFPHGEYVKEMSFDYQRPGQERGPE